MNDKSREGYAPLEIGAIPMATGVYQARWPDDWEQLYRSDVAEWRCNLVREIDSRLAALESAPDAEQVLDLQLRLAGEYDGRVAAEAKLAAIRKLMPNMWDDLGGGYINVPDILDILNGVA